MNNSHLVSDLVCGAFDPSYQKRVVADPTWVQSTTAIRYVCSDYFVVDNIVYMGIVSIVNNSQHVL